MDVSKESAACIFRVNVTFIQMYIEVIERGGNVSVAKEICKDSGR